MRVSAGTLNQFITIQSVVKKQGNRKYVTRFQTWAKVKFQSGDVVQGDGIVVRLSPAVFTVRTPSGVNPKDFIFFQGRRYRVLSLPLAPDSVFEETVEIGCEEVK